VEYSLRGLPGPLVPAKVGTQILKDWIPAYAGMSGV